MPSDSLGSRPRQVVLKHPRGGTDITVDGDSVTLMGVINRSPESNSLDAYAKSSAHAVEIARRYRKSGIELVDVGGQSTNFRNPRISIDEERRRLIPTVHALVDEGWVVSVDTFRPQIAQEAVAAGAALINDTSGLQDPDMVQVVSDARIPVVMMYLDGNTPLMVEDYDDSPGRARRIAADLKARLDDLASKGITSVVVDPGSAINYPVSDDRLAKSNFDMAEFLHPLTALPAPVLYAVSRWERHYWNVALAALAMAAGAAMLRIHDVRWIAEVAWLMSRTGRKPEEMDE